MIRSDHGGITRNIIFDLDGTLIDSAPSIIDSLNHAFLISGLRPKIEINRSFIGPPLMETLSLLAGTRANEVLDPLASAFKIHYDTEGYKLTEAFPHVEQMLLALCRGNKNIYIATNKRSRPTLLIVDLLGWKNIFDGVFSLDGFAPDCNTKAEMLKNIVTSLDMDVSESIYIGDRNEDQEAAISSGLPFIMVGWGYQGESEVQSKKLKDPKEIMEFI